MHARNQQDAQEAKPAAVCMRAHLPANERAIPHSPLLPQSDTCATDLCLDWQTDDDTVGRDRDKPLQVSKSAKCGVKKMQLAAFCLRFVSCTSCFRWWVLLIAMCHTCCCVQQQIDQLTLDTFPLVKTPSEECIRDQLETCICTSAQSYHRA
jgi:hypothetical protein